VRPTTAFGDNVFGINAPLHPSTILRSSKGRAGAPLALKLRKTRHPASWASDASALALCPALRAPTCLKAPVAIDDILEALRELDGGPRNPPGGRPNRLCSMSRALAA